jgi:hypothetical protein
MTQSGLFSFASGVEVVLEEVPKKQLVQEVLRDPTIPTVLP